MSGVNLEAHTYKRVPNHLYKQGFLVHTYSKSLPVLSAGPTVRVRRTDLPEKTNVPFARVVGGRVPVKQKNQEIMDETIFYHQLPTTFPPRLSCLLFFFRRCGFLPYPPCPRLPAV